MRLKKAAERRSQPKEADPDALTQADPKPLQITANRSAEKKKKPMSVQQQMLMKKIKERASKVRSEDGASVESPSKKAFAFASKKKETQPQPAITPPQSTKKKVERLPLIDEEDSDVVEVKVSPKKVVEGSRKRPAELKTPDRPTEPIAPNAPKRVCLEKIRESGAALNAKLRAEDDEAVSMEMEEAAAATPFVQDVLNGGDTDYCILVYKVKVDKNRAAKIAQLLAETP